MIVDLGADFFVAEPVGDSKAAAVNCEKVHFVVNVLSHGHFILPSKGLLDEIIDQAQRHGTQSMIELVKKAISEGKELTYGDIRLLIDDDPSEKEYENEHLNQHTR